MSPSQSGLHRETETLDKIMQWVELYGNASAFAAISLCAGDKRIAETFAATAAKALDKVCVALGEERQHDA